MDEISTFSSSQLDSTYTNDGDNSITIAKTTARACTETAGTDKNIASVNKRISTGVQKHSGGDLRPLKQKRLTPKATNTV